MVGGLDDLFTSVDNEMNIDEVEAVLGQTLGAFSKTTTRPRRTTHFQVLQTHPPAHFSVFTQIPVLRLVPPDRSVQREGFSMTPMTLLPKVPRTKRSTKARLTGTIHVSHILTWAGVGADCRNTSLFINEGKTPTASR